MLPMAIDRAESAAVAPILAIDTTSGACSVALRHRGGCEQILEPTASAHSRRALAMVAELLGRTGLGPGDLSAVAFGAGPGSFTGLRIACGLAQGLGLGWRLPLVAVDSVSTLALQAAVRRASGTVLVALDARMGESYTGAWQIEGTALRPLVPVAAATPEAASAAFERLLDGGPAVLAGDAFAPGGALAGWAARLPAATRPPDSVRPEARAVAALAAQRLQGGHRLAPADAAPIYVRDKVALDVAEQAALRAMRTTVPGAAR